MKIDTNKLFDKIPNGTELKLTEIGEGFPFREETIIVYKQDEKLIDKTSEFWWN